MTRPTTNLLIPVGPADHILGNAYAKLTLVEYGDYACPYSRHAFGTVAVIRRRLGGQLRFVFRHFPVVDRDPLAEEAAEAAFAAGAQGRFWEAYDKLFSENLESLLADPAAMAQQLGIDPVRFTAELRDGTYREAVAQEAQGGIRSGIHGTPTFFINGVRFTGSWELHTLLQALRTRLRTLPASHAAVSAATL